ncbi:MAG: ribbon-helix-helix domain-containing protein [Chloroflexota bacterium]
MEKTTVYLGEDLQKEIEALAKRTRRSQSVVIREALATYVANQRPQSISIGAVADGTVSGRDAHRRLRDEWGQALEEKFARRPESPE